MQQQVILSQIPLSQIEEIIKRCVNDAMALNTPTAIPDESEVTFSISELADYLKVTKATIHAYKNRKIFNWYQTGRTVYFKKSEIDQALLVGNKKEQPNKWLLLKSLLIMVGMTKTNLQKSNE